MKTATLFSLYFGFAVSAALAAEISGPERLEIFRAALQSGGATGMLAIAQSRGWPAPWMPSKWHAVNRMADKEKIEAVNAARDFGLALAEGLESEAERFQKLPSGGELCALSHRLCDLSDWCAGADGLGNLLLAQRCLDIAAVGLGRVTANLGFPLEECKRLASRMSPPPAWMSIAMRCRVLDAEAGTNLFAACRTQEDMRRVWTAGVRLWWRPALLKVKGLGTEVPDSALFEDDVRPKPMLQKAASFFEEQEPYDDGTPVTCRTRWDRRSQERVLAGLELQSIEKASCLLRFREEIGYFPEKFVRSKEERLLLEKDIEEAEKWGGKITPMEESPSFDPLKESFRRAWMASAKRNLKDYKDYNAYSTAARAYKEITAGKFYDSDTANIRRVEERMKLRRELRQHEAADVKRTAP
jgi:hypothetical protein